MRARRAFAVVVVVIAIVGSIVTGVGVAPSIAGAASSDLDVSFGGTGAVTANLGVHELVQTVARDVAMAPDGTVVVAATDLVNAANTDRDFLVERFAAGGSPDATFGGDGIATADFGGGTQDEVNAATVQSDGKVVVVGSTVTGGVGNVAVARFDTDGALDATFGAGGLATVQFGTGNAFRQGNAIAIDSVGRVVVGASGPTIDPPNSGNAFTVIRLTPAGTPDPTFSGDGVAQLAGGAASSLAIASDDSILVAGRSTTAPNPNRTALVRFTSTGTLDPTFNGTGKFTTSLDSCRLGCRLAMDGTGRPLLAARNGVSAVVQRFLADGGVDGTFASTGTVTFSFGPAFASGIDVAADSTGRIVVTGTASGVSGNDQEIGVARFSDDGTPDAAFDGDGVKTVTATANPNTAVGIAVDGGDNVLVAALDDPPGRTQRIGVAALLAGDGSLDQSFDGDGRAVGGLERAYDSFDRAFDVATDGLDRVVAVGTASDGSVTTGSMVRFDAYGSPDLTFGATGIVTTQGEADHDLEWHSVAIDASMRIVVAGRQCIPDHSFCMLAVGRYTSAGVLDSSFAGDGIAEVSDLYSYLPDLALDSRGRPVISTGPAGEVLVRLTTSGALDATFAGGAPIHLAQTTSGTYRMALDAQDRVIVAGTVSSTSWVISRYDASGQLDPSFGSDGTATVIPVPPSQFAYSFVTGLAVDGSGRIVIVGGGANPSTDVFVFRLDATGAVDPGFGAGGVATVDVDAANDYPQGVAVDRAGRLTIAVRTGAADPFGAALVRLDETGAPAAGFGTNGHIAIGDGGYEDIIGGVTIDTDGRIVTAGVTTNANRNEDFGIFRLVGDPAPPDPTPPTATITAPADGASFVVGEAVVADYTCADDFGGIGIGTCTGTTPAGATIDTTTIGSYTFTVTATDLTGNTSTTTVSFDVHAPVTAPGPASIQSVITGNGSATVAFTPPSSDGGSPITQYIVTCSSPGDDPVAAAGLSSPLVVADLVNGHSYTCVVRTENIVGGSISAPSDPFVPSTVPAAPPLVLVVVSGPSASVHFAASVSDGGSTVTGYTAGCISSDGGAPRLGAGPASPISVVGLSAGKTYTCVVTATNARGTSGLSPASNVVTVANVPGAPTGAAATTAPTAATTGSLGVSFVAPVSNGGSSITSYTATCSSSNGGATRTGSAGTSPITVTGATTGRSYTCTVRATNAIGAGPASVASPAVIVGAPAAPTGVTAAPGTGALVVSFTAGANNGAAVTSFAATCVSTNGGVTASKSGATSPLTVTSLTNAKTYTCTVKATSSRGAGAASAPSVAAIVGAPAAPTSLKAVPGTATATTGSLVVSFTAGANNGAAVTSFAATCVSSNGGVTASKSGAASPLTVTGLTTAKSYTCTVKATNARGAGPASAASPVVIVGAPVAPTGVTVVKVAAGQLRVTFTPGANNGAAVTSFAATCVSSNGGATRSKTGAASPLVVTGLTAARLYACTVKATNSRGQGLASTVSATVSS